MIDKQVLIDRLGKKRAIEFMTNNRSNQPTAFDKTKGIKGRIRHRRCEHGTWIIENYIAQPCVKCFMVPRETKPRDFKPYFNIGLGAFVESRSEEKKLAKEKQYAEAG